VVPINSNTSLPLQHGFPSVVVAQTNSSIIREQIRMGCRTKRFELRHLSLQV
jgi:hypothetical protein